MERRVCKLHRRLGQIVKDRCYLVDNLCCDRLSDLNHAVNDKVRCGTEAWGNSPMSRKPGDLGSRHPTLTSNCCYTSLLRLQPGSERNGPEHHLVTRKTTLLFSVFLGVVTVTKPVVAPLGTVVLISDFETTVNIAVVPLKVTLVALFKFVPRIVTAAPTLPEVGLVSTNGPSPTPRLKTVPQQLESKGHQVCRHRMQKSCTWS